MTQNKSILKISIFLMILLLLSAQFFNFLIKTVNSESDSKTKVLYLGDSTGRIYSSITLDKENIIAERQSSSEINLSLIDNYDVVIINDINLSLSDLSILESWAKIEGHGIIVLMGKNLTQKNYVLDILNITSETEFSNNTGDIVDETELSNKKGLSLVNKDLDPNSSPILKIIWNTAPESFYFTLIPNLEPDVVSYVKMQWAGNLSSDENYPLLCGKKLGENKGPNVFVYSTWFQDEFDNINANQHVMVWPFFNYLMFISIQISVGKPVPEFGTWNYAPVPHTTNQIIIGIIIAIITLCTIFLYRYAKKFRHKEHDVFIAEDLFKSESAIESQESRKIEEIVPEEKIYVDKSDDWEAIGFHRHISGFLKLFFLMVMLLIPQLLITSIVMPRFLNPYPQASGWYSYTLRFFESIWLVFDMGFNFALTKYFAQYRIESPRKAYHYIQLFVWWEVFSGIAQIFLIAFLGSIIIPLTNFSYLSWMFVVHSLIQFPGFYLVFQYFFQGNQRADYFMISFALQYFVLRMAMQVITVPIFRLIYQNKVMYGPAFGAGIGLLIGQMIGDFALFLITWKIYSKMGLPIKPIFLAEFNKEEFIESIKFGGKMVLGQVWVPAVWLLQVYLVGIFLPNASAEQGYFELAFTIATIPQAISLLMTSMLGGLTEAHQYKKQNLLNYTSFSGMKWGSLWTFYLCAVIWAIGQEFIIGASGPNWIRAAALIPYLMIFQMLGPISWQCDYEFASANKPLYAGIAWILEQSIRATLTYTLLVLMRRMEAVVIAYIISLSIKDIFVLTLVRRKIHKWDWNLWQAFIAPLISALCTYLILRGIVWIIVYNLFGIGIISAMLIFIIGLFLMEYIYIFIDSFIGGFDDNTIKELDRATKMITGVYGLARFYYKMAYLGAKISPLHNKFKVKIFELAQKEAEELTSIKKKIVVK
ncbi:MAG: lipopolysaccharide biosynthesis protein [Promethearchaeota archaeon]